MHIPIPVPRTEPRSADVPCAHTHQHTRRLHTAQTKAAGPTQETRRADVELGLIEPEANVCDLSRKPRNTRRQRRRWARPI
eukprot:scaffold67896_cov60-Phaeocystis_antarctica.AAC.4